MNKFVYNPNEYSATNFKPIPQGDHRVKISEVTYQNFSNGKPGYEITLEVSGYNNKLWHYITIDYQDTKKTNQRLGSFFNSFGITNYDLDDYENWIGHDGAVRVKHDTYEGRTIARVAFCLHRRQQDRLPAWKEKKKPSNNIAPCDMDEGGKMPSSFPPRGFGGFSF